MARRCEKWGVLLWIFAEGREIGGVYWSVIGHRLRVGVARVKGKVQEWCKGCGLGWKCGKGGVKHQSWVPHDGGASDVGHPSLLSKGNLQLPYPSRTLTRIEAMAPELQLPVHVHTGPLQFRMQSELASIRINFRACSVDLLGKQPTVKNYCTSADSRTKSGPAFRRGPAPSCKIYSSTRNYRKHEQWEYYHEGPRNGTRDTQKYRWDPEDSIAHCDDRDSYQ